METSGLNSSTMDTAMDNGQLTVSLTQEESIVLPSRISLLEIIFFVVRSVLSISDAYLSSKILPLAEIIALHEANVPYSANAARGAQLYMNCVQIKVTSSGGSNFPGGSSFPGT